MVEKNNKLLMKNHQAMPTSEVAISKVNVINIYIHSRDGRGRNNRSDREHGYRQYFKPKNTYQKMGRNN